MSDDVMDSDQNKVCNRLYTFHNHTPAEETKVRADIEQCSGVQNRAIVANYN